MEGVGGRLGRSSTRYGPTSTVFTGPVRKWKKMWLHIPPPPSNNSIHNKYTHTNPNNANNNNNNNHKLLFYKWAPQGQPKEQDDDDDDDDDDVTVHQPPKRKFRYVPVAVLEEQQNEAEENEDAEDEAVEKVEDEAKLNDAIPDVVEPKPKNDGLIEKPDINDVPMEENEDADDAPSTRQDLNVGFNLNSNDGDPESDANADEK